MIPSRIVLLLGVLIASTAVEGSSHREHLLLKAKLAEQEMRYKDMAVAMKGVVETGRELTIEERNLLSMAYQKVVDAIRHSWRVLSSNGAETDGPNADIEEHREMLEKQLRGICEEVINLLDTFLIPMDLNAEPKVFYLKMKGDYYRYLAEVAKGDTRKDAAENAQSSYKTAYEIALSELLPTNPTRLRLALNFSTFYHEILNAPEEACALAKKAFDDAIAELDTVSEVSYKDTTSIMQLIRDNLELWTSEAEHEVIRGMAVVAHA